jgi:DNA-binding NarL/FixJ family response regulator
MVRLLIADDHSIMRCGLKQLFALSPDIEVIGEAENGEELLALLPEKTFDLLLMDLMMPGICSIDLIGRIRSSFPDLAILVLSMHNEHQVALRAIRAGASGYITKDSDPEKLLAAIFKVADGGRYLDPALAEEMAFYSPEPEQEALHERLSEREHEVFLLLAKGMGVNEIANQLGISNKTVSTHKMRLMEKMNFSSLSDLVRYAVQLEH